MVNDRTFPIPSNTTKDFRVLRIGTSIRVNKQSFDSWFAAV